MSELENWHPEAVVESMRAAALGAGSDERTARFEAIERAADARRVVEVMAAFGVPERYRDDIRTLRETPAIAAARRWMAGDKRDRWGLVLGGHKGLGKSVAAAWWLSQVAHDMKPSTTLFRRWWTAVDLQRVGNWGEELDGLWSVHSLVIDDLGAEFSDEKGNFASLIYGLIEKRSANYLRTVITTNLSWDAMRARYDERIIDRLRSGTVLAGVSGKSLRGAT
jgi:DNA replication protein DnaC